VWPPPRESGAEQFSPELFRSKVEEHFKDWVEDNGLSEKQAAEFKEQLDERVICYADDSEHEARRQLNDFSEKIDGTTLEFYDTWEWDFREYTYRFIWCCYALAWSIRKYDERNLTVDKSVQAVA
jgi:hypothetical protein